MNLRIAPIALISLSIFLGCGAEETRRSVQSNTTATPTPTPLASTPPETQYVSLPFPAAGQSLSATDTDINGGIVHVSASSILDPNVAALAIHTAFDGMIDNNSSGWHSAAGNSGSIQIDFPNKLKAKALELASMRSGGNTPLNSPKSFTLQAKNDGEDWVDLHSESGLAAIPFNSYTKYSFSNDIAYKSYRLVIHDVVASTSNGFVCLGEMRLLP